MKKAAPFINYTAFILVCIIGIWAANNVCLILYNSYILSLFNVIRKGQNIETTIHSIKSIPIPLMRFNKFDENKILVAGPTTIGAKNLVLSIYFDPENGEVINAFLSTADTPKNPIFQK